MKPLEFFGRVLSFDAGVFETLQTSPRALEAALLVVLLAGLSEALGQSVVLFANRVKPRRFGFSLLINALLYLLGFGVFVLTLWLLTTYSLGKQQPLSLTLVAVGWGYAPHLFGVFALAPYLGGLLTVLLSLWSFLIIAVAVKAVFGVSLLNALLVSGAAWLLVHLIRRTLGRPLVGLSHRIEAGVAGVPLVTDRAKLRALYRERLLEARPDRET